MLLSLLLAGCIDYKEYEDLSLVFGMGFDYNPKEDTVYTTIDHTNKSSSDGESSDMFINTAYNNTLEESIDNLQKYVQREIFLGYVKCIIIGKDAAESHFEDIISYLDLTPRIRTTSYILIAEDTAFEILATHDPTEEQKTSDVIEKLLLNTTGTGGFIPVSLGNLYKMLYFEGMELTLPLIKTEDTIKPEADSEDSDTQGKNKKEQYTELPEGMGYVLQKSGQQHVIEGIAVFKDMKLIGFLDQTDGYVLALIKDQEIEAYISESFDYKGSIVDYSYRNTENSSTLDTKIEDGKPVIDLTINLKGSIEKITNVDNLFDTDTVESIENKISQDIKEQINTTITKVQKNYNSDIFGFGYQFYINDNKAWKEDLKNNWDELFKDLKVNVTVNVDIKNSGRKIRFNL